MAKRKMTKELFNKAIQVASGYFLCKNFPDNWHELEEEKLNEFILDNVWEPFEGWEAGDIFQLIENAAFSTEEFLKQEDFIA